MSEEHSTIEYRDIPGFPGYRVGDDGSVWTRKNGKWGLRLDWKPMKVTFDKTRSTGRAYGHLSLTHNGVQSTRLIHTLILEVFVGHCPPGMECRHLDGNPTNNTLSNLCWGTPQSNADDRIKHGRVRHGESLTFAKLKPDDIRYIRTKFQLSRTTKQKLAVQFGVSRAAIRAIISRKNWKHVE